MILRSLFDADKDKTITIEYEDGEKLPEYGEEIYFDGDEMWVVKVGEVLFDKYNVITYEVIEQYPEEYDSD
jgi:hypothetical protein